ncbi:unnamed protein product [Calicophoron daubneyi]|uniref:Transient receptor potential cation channel subfamily M member 3 n=1 Tax=Calicophoron daubneyi TaxID=300641 RepID=A0AAV2T943_CALDB
MREGRMRTVRHLRAEERLKKETEEKNAFIASHFSFKECIKFTPNPETAKADQEIRCYCGEYEDKHFYNEAGEDVGDNQWTESTHIKKFYPTNAYGQIEFLTKTASEHRRTEFLRMSDEDSLDDAMKLMKKYWKMMRPKKPSLCITVIGGAKNFSLEGRKKAVFNTGIVQATNTSDAWIITSGLNLGITRMVGDALEEGRASMIDPQRPSNQFRCLGISPWGYVLNREALISDNHMKTVLYHVSGVIESGRPVSLNPNHTHYIFVDEGRRNRYGGSASAVFRSRLEKQIALPIRSGGWGIPVVLLIVEGGHDVFIDASNSIRQGVPVVICSGTGRAADILSMAFKFRVKHLEEDFREFSAEEIDTLRQRLMRVSGEKKIKEALEDIVEIVKDPKLITIFDMNMSGDLDLAILYSLIKTNSRITVQLNLAFAWDRSDIVETKILQQGQEVEPESLYPLMMRSLLKNKIEFMKVLLKNGVSLREFLTFEKLHQLYNESVNRESLLYCMIKNKIIDSEEGNPNLPKRSVRNNHLPLLRHRGKRHQRPTTVYLSDIARLLEKMIGRFKQNEYSVDVPSLETDELTWGLVREYTFHNPSQDLFLWALLHHRHDMAIYFWRLSEDSIVLALVACVVYLSMVDMVPSYDNQTRSLYESQIDEFEELAVHVLEECYEEDPVRTESIVRRPNPLWGGQNCLELASNATRQKFMSVTACQNCLNFAWFRGINANLPMSILCTVCPLFLFSNKFIKFDTGRSSAFQTLEDKGGETDTSLREEGILDDCSDLADEEPDIHQAKGSKDDDNDRVIIRQSDLSFKKKLEIFYGAPYVKFILECVIYSTFLLLFSYALLFRIHKDSITGCEAFIMAYFVGVCVEILRQIYKCPVSCKEKIPFWWTVFVWMRIDLAIAALAIVSMLLRIRQETFIVARTFYAITLILCYLRIYRLFVIHPRLGPKLVMIERMIRELVVFLLILVIILVAYGVAAQSLLFPNRKELDWKAVRDVFYYPYWNLFGELLLEYPFPDEGSCPGPPDGVKCPHFNFVVPVLLAVYLMIATILMVNLLIAIFSNIFEEVEEKSIEIWKFGFYNMVCEYILKSRLPIPFSIVETLVVYIHGIWKCCCLCRSILTARRNADLRNVTQEMNSVLIQAVSAQDRAATGNETSGDLNVETIGDQMFGFTMEDEEESDEEASRDDYADFVPSPAPPAEQKGSDDILQEEPVVSEEVQAARMFVNNCKRKYLKKVKHNKAKTVDAGIEAIQAKLDKLVNEVTLVVAHMQQGNNRKSIDES